MASMTHHSGWLLLTSWILALAFTGLTPVEGAEYSPEIGVCITVSRGALTYLDCLSGEANFCCRTELIATNNNISFWGKRCCTQTEFVKENSTLFTILVYLTLGSIDMLLFVAIASCSSLILAKKTDLEDLKGA